LYRHRREGVWYVELERPLAGKTSDALQRAFDDGRHLDEREAGRRRQCVLD
jgi:hypothetical protein